MNSPRDGVLMLKDSVVPAILTACPKCANESRTVKGALVLVRDDVASCRFHGEMSLTEVFDCISGLERPQNSFPVFRGLQSLPLSSSNADT